jgi:CDP-glucose 4,6-dehydratase
MGIVSILKRFKGKKVFITGHTGFKGSWLTYLLDQYGAFTRGYALAPYTSPSLYSSLSLSKQHSSLISDINDFERLKKEINNFQPEFIFHLAAQPLVIKSYFDPRSTFNTNFVGTLNLLEILRKSSFSSTAIFITTDKVYENKELNQPFTEGDKLGGKDPYSASKAASEMLIHSYYNSYFKGTKTNLATVRAGNVIGGGDWSDDRLIPDLIRAIFEKKNLKIRNSLATRPWQHVLEPLYGYMKLALELEKDPLNFSGAWNFGPEPDDIKTVGEIIKIVQDLNFNLASTKVTKNNLEEAQYLSLDISKVKSKLKLKPRWNSKDAFIISFNWYKRFYNGESPSKLIDEDIKTYNLK